MNNLFEALSEVSGLSTEKIREIAKDVAKNNAILKDCPLHNFVKQEGSRRKYVCTNCKGVVESIHRTWYENGLRHGKNIK